MDRLHGIRRGIAFAERGPASGDKTTGSLGCDLSMGARGRIVVGQRRGQNSWSICRRSPKCFNCPTTLTRGPEVAAGKKPRLPKTRGETKMPTKRRKTSRRMTAISPKFKLAGDRFASGTPIRTAKSSRSFDTRTGTRQTIRDPDVIARLQTDPNFMVVEERFDPTGGAIPERRSARIRANGSWSRTLGSARCGRFAERTKWLSFHSRRRPRMRTRTAKPDAPDELPPALDDGMRRTATLGCAARHDAGQREHGIRQFPGAGRGTGAGHGISRADHAVRALDRPGELLVAEALRSGCT